MHPSPTASPEGRASLRVATVTVSDTRSSSTDVSGERLRELLSRAGFALVAHRIVLDEPDAIRSALTDAVAEGADAVVTTGGTGIAPRDVTVEVVSALFEKTLDGFGEAFRRLSWDAIGPRAVLSRAVAGVVGGRFVAALPGSPKAVELAVNDVLVPILEHAVRLARGETGHGKSGGQGHGHGGER
jgi:molybdenum cofactor biosynthesis protein B